jgi:hypothetical protein
MTTISIAQDFSKYPGGRYLSDGPYSGQLFRTKHLVPVLGEDKIIVILDGVRGYGSSFLEEAFGGLVRERLILKSSLLQKLEIKAQNQSLITEIKGYIHDAIPKENE